MDFIKESYTDEMKQKYDEYLTSHISNVQKGFKYLCDKHIVELDLIKATFPKIEEQIRNHDQSKYSKEEYDPYVEYFYGEKDEKGEVYPDVQDRFDEAWNHHQKRNPHHWQYWLLREDDGDFKCIHMDYNYIIEMVCDWWAFSWKQNNLYEIFNWYEENKSKMKMHKNTIRDLEELLKQIKTQLDLDKSDGDYSSKDLNESSQATMIKELEDAGYKYKWDKYSPEQIFRIHQKNVLNPKPKKEVKEQEKIELPEYRIINGEKHIRADGGTYVKLDSDHFEESIRNESDDTFILNAMEHVLDVFDSNACDMAMRGLKRKFEKKFHLTEEEWERYDKVAMKRWYIKNYGEERWKRHVDSIKQDLDTDIEPQEEDNREFFNNN